MSRTIQTFNHIADVLDCHFIPVTKSWRLNEKHYGQLQVPHPLTQGRNRSEVVGQHGEAQVKLWRRSYDVAPPALEKSDPRHPMNDRRYKDIDPAILPVTEVPFRIYLEFKRHHSKSTTDLARRHQPANKKRPECSAGGSRQHPPQHH